MHAPGVGPVARSAAVSLQQLWPECADAPDVAVSGLVVDHRQVQAGSVYVALRGRLPTAQMQQFADQARQQGAALVISELPLVGAWVRPDVRAWLGVLARRFLQVVQPVAPLRVAAVTGTNGKTTISRLLAELLAANGQRAAVLGTTGNGILPDLQPSTHTTLDAVSLQRHLHQYAAQGAQFAVLEASSHGLEQGRLVGTPIEVALFSNLTRDHLDYHGDMASYAAAKARLFAWPELHTAILNADDPASATMRAACTPGVRVWTYSLHDQDADFWVKKAVYSLQGAALDLHTPVGRLSVQSPLLGRFNVANVLAALAGALALGLNLAQVAAAVPQLQGAPGRMQVVADDARLLLVDYAHTPDALAQVLSSVRPHVDGQVWVVFGCGGDRDRGKRPLMTEAALQYADRVVLTADNPRSEAVDAILADMQGAGGFLQAHRQGRVVVEPDRRQAIRLAVAAAQAGDAVVVAGKGHEDYQEIDGVRHWFDDAVELAQAVRVQPDWCAAMLDAQPQVQRGAAPQHGQPDAAPQASPANPNFQDSSFQENNHG